MALHSSLCTALLSVAPSKRDRDGEVAEREAWVKCGEQRALAPAAVKRMADRTSIPGVACSQP